MRKQRAIWESGSTGRLEIGEAVFRQTWYHCVACGRQGVWACGVEEIEHLVCPVPACKTVLPVGDGGPCKATDHWLTIVRQLQLAEAAAA